MSPLARNILTALCAAALCARCRRDEPSPAPADDPAPAPSALDRADLLRRELSAGRIPGGVESTVAELRAEADAARTEGDRSRREMAAADLVAARYRLTRSEPDLTRAEALYAGIARGDGPSACTALARSAELMTASGDARRTMEARQLLDLRCPGAAPARPQTAVVVARDAGAAAVPRAAVRRVVLDPGHGGQDPGAIGPTGLTESSVNLDVTRRLADRLSSAYGVQVVLTRDTDVYVELEDRAAQANASGADLFVSIHCNASANTEAHGISTFVLETTSDRINARVLAREGELVAFDPGSSDLPRILADMRLSSQGSLSFALASRMQEAMLHDVGLFHGEVADLGVHPARFQVLVTARMPAVLVELSFISNPTEEQRLRSDAYRDVLASALARTIARGGG